MQFFIIETINSDPEDDRAIETTPDFEHVSDLVHWLATLGGGADAKYCRKVADWFMSGAKGKLKVHNGACSDVWVIV